MRGFTPLILSYLMASVALAQPRQELIVVGKDWQTFIRVDDFNNTSYVPLVQVAALINGRVEPKKPSKNVQLAIGSERLRFTADSAKVLIRGKGADLDKPAVMNDEGFWIPFEFFSSEAFTRISKTRLAWPQEAVEAELEKAPGVPTPLTPQSRLRSKALKRIVIDPGHGGKDPGAVGKRGTLEKIVNLRMSLELAEVLREKYGYEVLLTRMEDVFVPLEARAKLANKHNADLFVSLHCNASTYARKKGFEVYFLSERASDSQADAVARFENSVLALEGKDDAPPSGVMRVLRSLVKTANINEASALGSLIDKHLADRLSEPSLGVKQAAFYVLRGADMPSVLVEMAFISNSQEEKLLQSPKFRRKMVEGIAAGIAAYDLRKQKERQ